jgi:signal transduction histidine kinase
MLKTQLGIFIVLANMILLVFITGIIVFIFQYHKRKLQYENEKALINEQHLQDLLNTKLEIQQQTMQDIGREIHDNVGQHLTLASIYTHQLAYENQLQPQNERLSEIGKIIDESLADLRSLSKNLTNQTAEITDLIVLIQHECNRVNDLNLYKINFSFDRESYKISTTAKNFILRIIQEFLQNSLKHANCKNVILKLAHSADGLSIHIRDDGKGFSLDAYAAHKSNGIGIANMKNRAELIGAVFSFTSIPGMGTMLDLQIPEQNLNAS